MAAAAAVVATAAKRALAWEDDNFFPPFLPQHLSPSATASVGIRIRDPSASATHLPILLATRCRDRCYEQERDWEGVRQCLGGPGHDLIVCCSV
jgi:hypothetical protein